MKSPDPSQLQSNTARQEASARHAARASASVGKLAIQSGQYRFWICVHSAAGLPAHIPVPQQTARVRPAYVSAFIAPFVLLICLVPSTTLDWDAINQSVCEAQLYAQLQSGVLLA